MLNGITKFELAIQHIKFKRLNFAFQRIKTVPALKDKDSSLLPYSTSRTERSFWRSSRTSVIGEHAEIQIGVGTLKKLMLKRQQTAFYSLKTFLSMYHIHHKVKEFSFKINA